VLTMAWNAQLLKIFAKICALAMLHRSYQSSSVNATPSRPSVCAKGSAAMGGFQTMLRRRRLCAESGKGRSQSTDATSHALRDFPLRKTHYRCKSCLTIRQNPKSLRQSEERTSCARAAFCSRPSGWH
jgi:hypothetical protein